MPCSIVVVPMARLSLLVSHSLPSPSLFQPKVHNGRMSQVDADPNSVSGGDTTRNKLEGVYGP